MAKSNTHDARNSECSMFWEPAINPSNGCLTRQLKAEATLWKDGVAFYGGTFLLPSYVPEAIWDSYVVDIDATTGIRYVNCRQWIPRNDTSSEDIQSTGFSNQIKSHDEPGSISILNNICPNGEVVVSAKGHEPIKSPRYVYSNGQLVPLAHESVQDRSLGEKNAHPPAHSIVDDILCQGQVVVSAKSQEAVKSPGYIYTGGQLIPLPLRSIAGLSQFEETADALSSSILGSIISDGQIVASAKDPKPITSSGYIYSDGLLLPLARADPVDVRKAFQQKASSLRIDATLPMPEGSGPLTTQTTDLSPQSVKPAKSTPATSAALSPKFLPLVPLAPGEPSQTFHALDVRNPEHGADDSDDRILAPLDVETSFRQRKNWYAIHNTEESENSVPRLYNPVAALTSTSGLISPDQMVLRSTVLNNQAAAALALAEKVSALPSFDVDTKSLSRACYALDVSSDDRSINCNDSQDALDLAVALDMGQHLKISPVFDQPRTACEAAEVEIVFDNSGNLCLAPANSAISRHDDVEGDVTQRFVQSSISDPVMSLEDIDLDAIFGQSATDLDAESEGTLPQVTDQSVLVDLPHPCLSNAIYVHRPGMVLPGLFQCFEVGRPDSGTDHGDTTSLEGQAESSLAAEITDVGADPQKSLRSIPLNIIDNLKTKYLQIWFEGAKEWTPGEDEAEVKAMAVDAIADDFANIPEDVVELMDNLDVSFNTLWQEGHPDRAWIAGQDEGQVRALAAVNLQWQYHIAELDEITATTQKLGKALSSSHSDHALLSSGSQNRDYRRVEVTKHDDDNDSMYERSTGGLQHHLNFFGQWSQYKSATPPAVSLFAVVTASRTLPLKEPVCRKAVLTAQANKHIDPFSYDGDLSSIDPGCRGTDLRALATGKTALIYQPYGAWMSDIYQENDDRPLPPTVPYEGVGAIDAYGRSKHYPGLQRPYWIPTHDIDVQGGLAYGGPYSCSGLDRRKCFDVNGNKISRNLGICHSSKLRVSINATIDNVIVDDQIQTIDSANQNDTLASPLCHEDEAEDLSFIGIDQTTLRIQGDILDGQDCEQTSDQARVIDNSEPLDVFIEAADFMRRIKARCGEVCALYTTGEDEDFEKIPIDPECEEHKLIDHTKTWSKRPSPAIHPRAAELAQWADPSDCEITFEEKPDSEDPFPNEQSKEVFLARWAEHAGYDNHTDCQSKEWAQESTDAAQDDKVLQEPDLDESPKSAGGVSPFTSNREVPPLQDGRYASPTKMWRSEVGNMRTPPQSPAKENDQGSWDTDEVGEYHTPTRIAHKHYFLNEEDGTYAKTLEVDAFADLSHLDFHQTFSISGKSFDDDDMFKIEDNRVLTQAEDQKIAEAESTRVQSKEKLNADLVKDDEHRQNFQRAMLTTVDEGGSETDSTPIKAKRPFAMSKTRRISQAMLSFSDYKSRRVMTKAPEEVDPDWLEWTWEKTAQEQKKRETLDAEWDSELQESGLVSDSAGTNGISLAPDDREQDEGLADTMLARVSPDNTDTEKNIDGEYHSSNLTSAKHSRESSGQINAGSPPSSIAEYEEIVVDEKTVDEEGEAELPAPFTFEPFAKSEGVTNVTIVNHSMLEEALESTPQTEEPKPAKKTTLSIVTAGDVLEAENSIDLPRGVALAAGDVVEAENNIGYGDVFEIPDDRPNFPRAFYGDVSIAVGHAAFGLGKWVIRKCLWQG